MNVDRSLLLVDAVRRSAATGDVRSMDGNAARIDLAISIRIIDNMPGG